MTWQPGQKVQLETPNYRIRSLGIEDASERFIAWAADPDVKIQLNSRPREMTHQQLIDHLASFDDVSSFNLGIFSKATGLIIGFNMVLYLKVHDSAEVTIVIGDRDYWGKKVVLEVRPAIIDFLFNEVGIVKVWGRPTTRNFAAVYNYRALGFTCEGILRQQLKTPDGGRTDQYIFGLLKDEWRARRAQKAAS